MPSANHKRESSGLNVHRFKAVSNGNKHPTSHHSVEQCSISRRSLTTSIKSTFSVESLTQDCYPNNTYKYAGLSPYT